MPNFQTNPHNIGKLDFSNLATSVKFNWPITPQGYETIS